MPRIDHAVRQRDAGLGHSAFAWGLGGLLTSAVQTLLVWQERARERHALAGLDDELAKDIGVGRSELYREVHKPFWRG